MLVTLLVINKIIIYGDQTLLLLVRGPSSDAIIFAFSITSLNSILILNDIQQSFFFIGHNPSTLCCSLNVFLHNIPDHISAIGPNQINITVKVYFFQIEFQPGNIIYLSVVTCNQPVNEKFGMSWTCPAFYAEFPASCERWLYNQAHMLQ